VYLGTWSDNHPVARAIATGSWWFDAWIAQKTTPISGILTTSYSPLWDAQLTNIS
jgi:hypothetical protein